MGTPGEDVRPAGPNFSARPVIAALSPRGNKVILFCSIGLRDDPGGRGSVRFSAIRKKFTRVLIHIGKTISLPSGTHLGKPLINKLLSSEPRRHDYCIFSSVSADSRVKGGL